MTATCATLSCGGWEKFFGRYAFGNIIAADLADLLLLLLCSVSLAAIKHRALFVCVHGERERECLSLLHA